MARTAPASVTETPGLYITSAWQTSQVKAVIDWVNGRPAFFGYQVTAQTLPNNSFAAITLDTEILDTDGGHSTTTNTSRYVCQVAGRYRLDGTVCMAGSTAGFRAAKFVVNGSNGVTGSEIAIATAGSSFNTIVYTGGTVSLAVGDYVEIHGFQNTGSTLGTVCAADTTYTSSMRCLWISS